MTIKRFDSRQSEHRSALQQLTGVDSNKTLKQILPAIDLEVTPPFALRASSTPDLTLNISSNILTNPETLRKKTNQPINKVIFEFAGGTVVFPSTSGSNAVVTPGDDVAITIANNEYLRVLVEITEDGEIKIIPGAASNAVENDAEFPEPSGTNLTIGYYTLFNNAGTIENIVDEKIVQFIGGGGSGGGGTIAVLKDKKEGETGYTITFDNETFSFDSNAHNFYRNGVLMKKVDSFQTPADTDVSIAHEYMEVNNAGDSNQILLNPNAAGEINDAAAAVDDCFELVKIENTFDGLGLAEKTLISARGFADGTGTVNCSVSTVSDKTRLTFAGTLSYNPGGDAGAPRGDLDVEVNGQDIERLIVGQNDTEGNIVYEEDTANGKYVDIYQIVSGVPAPLPAATPVRVHKAQYRVAELDAVNTSIIPALDNTYDLGSAGNRWRDIHLGPGSMKMHDGTNNAEVKMEGGKIGFVQPGEDFQEFGTGGGSGTNANLLALDENKELINCIFDDFESDIGATKVNTQLSGGDLIITPGQLSGTYEANKETTTSLSSVEVLAEMKTQMAAPKSEAIAANTIKFEGDVSTVFVAGEKVIIGKKLEQLGSTDHIWLLDNDENVARLEISSSTFSAVSGETDVVLLNPDSLDLSMGVITAELNDKLRVVPFNWLIEGSAGAALEELDLADMHGIDQVVIEGSNFYQLIESLDETIEMLDGKMSKNGQYGIIRLVGNNSGNDTYHWYYTKDRGNTWAKFADTRNFGQDTSDDNIANSHIPHMGPKDIGVANNGKWFCTYGFFNGSSFDVKAVLGDISLVTPTLVDLPDNANNNGGVGDVYAAVGTNTSSTVAIDEEDMTAICVAVTNQSNNNTAAYVFDETGANIAYSGFIGANVGDFDAPFCTAVTGTAPNRRAHWVMTRSDTGAINAFYFNEATSWTFVAYSGEEGSPSKLMDIAANDEYLSMIYLDETSNDRLTIQTINHAVTDTAGPNRDLSRLAIDTDNGRGPNADSNLMKNSTIRARFNPADNKHLFIACDLKDFSSNAVASHLVEIKDVSDILVGPGNSTGGNNTTWNFDANTTKIAQTFTLSSAEDIRSIMIGLRTQTASGKYKDAEFTMTIEDTSGGAPIDGGGTVLATSRPASGRLLSPTTNGNYLYFNFETPVNLAAGTYAAIVSTDEAPNGTDFLALITAPSDLGNDSYGANDAQDTWSARGKTGIFQVNGHWIEDVGLGRNIRNGSHTIKDCEAAIEYIDDNQLKYTFRRSFQGGGADRNQQGVPFERTINISNTAAKSTFTDLNCAVYDEMGAIPDYDRNLVGNWALGIDLARKKDGVSGALTQNQSSSLGSGIFDLSEFGHNVSGQGGTIALATDSDFQEGVALDFNGSNNYTLINHSPFLDIGRSDVSDQNGAFAIEAEININAAGSGRCIISKARMDSGIEAGWWFQCDPTTSGFKLTFDCYDETSTFRNTESQDDWITSGTFCKVKVTRAGAGQPVRLWKSEGADLTAGPNGTALFTEATYAVQDTFNNIADAAGRDMYIGTRDNSISAGVQLGQYFSGKIGYVKFANESETFAYDGWKPQQAVVSTQSIGANLVLGRRFRGRVASDYYYDAGVAKDGKPFVDSYKQLMIWRKSFQSANRGTMMQFKATLNRAVASLQSGIEKIKIAFDK